MNKAMNKTILALAVMATTLPALAESVDIQVKGTITPTACTPTLSGGGVVDYGNINPNSLSTTAVTELPAKQVDFTITCDAPAKVAFKAVNGRPNTLVSDVAEDGHGVGVPPINLGGISAGSTRAAGLGLDGTDKIGGYTMYVLPSSSTADGVSVDTLARSLLTSNNWVVNDLGKIWQSRETEVSWAEAGKTEPLAFETLASKLVVLPYINKASELDLTKPVTLDGLSTLELVYL